MMADDPNQYAMIVTWNPDKYHWNEDEYADYVTRTTQGEVVEIHWSTGNRVGGISHGDRVYLLRQGTRGRGIIGSGSVISDIYQEEDWDGSGGSANYVAIALERLVHPSDLLPTERLKQKLPETKWDRIQGGGILIRGPQAKRLENLWNEHIGGGTNSATSNGQQSATSFRLDTADLALEAGWEVESTDQTDTFIRSGVKITVHYSEDDDIVKLTRSSNDSGDEILDQGSDARHDQLRMWLV